MTDAAQDARLRSARSDFRKVPTSEDWFDAYQLATDLFAFHEPRHWERTIANLVVGSDAAVLIDTGCGIGDLRRAVEAVTDKPIRVVNTHTHADHLGGNRHFDDIALFDHPASRRVAERGLSAEVVRTEILDERLVTGPWPRGFDPSEAALPPFEVRRWLRDGDRIDLGDRDLEVIHTPGEAVDHICLLDRRDRVLFCGDILLEGEVWTHLEGGSLDDLIRSYRRLMDFFDDFDRLMPSHNEPWLDRSLLPETLAAAEDVASGRAEYQEVTDPWSRRLRKYAFGRFSIMARA